jgi:hypothetical protein
VLGDAKCRALGLDFGAGRPGVHAPVERLADDLLARDDPNLARDGLASQRRVRVSALVVGLGVGPLVDVASGPRRGRAAARSRGPRQKSIEEKVVDKIVERTEIDEASAGLAG